MMYTQFKAEAALDTRIQENITDIDISFPNIPYTPSVTEPYIKITHNPGVKVQASLGETGMNRISGTMFVYVSYPIGTYPGTYDASRTAGNIVALFELGTSLTYEDVTIRTTRAQVIDAIQGEVRYTPVVSIEWYAYVEKDTII